MLGHRSLTDQTRGGLIKHDNLHCRKLASRLSRPVRCQGAASDPLQPSASDTPRQSQAERTPVLGRSNMPRRSLIHLAGAATLGSLCPCVGCTPPAQADGPGAGVWEYGQLEGPKNWSGVCRAGAAQSPIDVPLGKLFVGGPSAGKSNLGPIDFMFPSAARAAVLNTGHGTMQVNVPNGNFMSRIGGRLYELLQFHFHTPSEHTFDGKHFPMEAHLVHRDVETGGLAVCGVMLKRGDSPICLANPALQWALSYAPCYPQATLLPMLPVNVKALLPKLDANGERPYVHYSGSLTTPPCSEQVKWFVFTEPVTVTDKQILDFGLYCGGQKQMLATNARPVMPLEGRDLVYFA